MSKVVVEPYNAVFSTSHLVVNSDETFFMDNEALHDICLHTLKLTAASYQEMNLLISAAMAGNSSYYFGHFNVEYSYCRLLAVSFIVCYYCLGRHCQR